MFQCHLYGKRHQYWRFVFFANVPGWTQTEDSEVFLGFTSLELLCHSDVTSDDCDSDKEKMEGECHAEENVLLLFPKKQARLFHLFEECFIVFFF